MRLIDSWGSYGIKEAKLYSPTDMAVGQDGTVYICGGSFGDPFEMIRVQCLTRTGTYLRWFGGYQNGLQEEHWLVSPSGVGAAPDGSVWVTQSVGKRISQFTSEGEYLGRFKTWVDEANGLYHYPGDLSIDAEGDIYLVDPGNDLLLKFDPAGNNIWVWGEKEKKQGKVRGLWTCAAAADGSVFVGDYITKKIFQVDSDGTLLNTWGATGSQAGRFQDIEKVCVGPDGSLYVLDATLNRIQRFGPDGTLITKWGGQGTSKMKFRQAYCMAVSPEGFVYVMDYKNNYAKVKVFATKAYKPKGTMTKLVGYVKGAPADEIPKLLVRVDGEDGAGTCFYTQARPNSGGRFVIKRLAKGNAFTLRVLGYDSTRYRVEPEEISGTAGQVQGNQVFRLVDITSTSTR
jgi:sugar lactone lactonase YvrE